MSIVSSVKSEDSHNQRDGSRYVYEIHTDNTGRVFRFTYLASPAMLANCDAVMAARAAQINDKLPEEEVDVVLAKNTTPVLTQQTPTEFLQRLRARYRDASREELAHIARWLIRRLDAGNVTTAQLRNAFGLSVPQWSTMETKMRNLAASLDALEMAVGE